MGSSASSASPTSEAIRALAEEAEGAALMGIDVSRIRAVAFGIGSACVAVAGALVTPFLYVAPDVGESFNIIAFVVVVLGGMGNFLGALFGGFIVGLAESLGAAILPGSLKHFVVFVIFVPCCCSAGCSARPVGARSE
jgi:branched-chain amino acid transport system permease protein